MSISIQKAKNGEDTAKSENHFLHSAYAPSKEAQRFIENIFIPYKPEAIIITEPCLSYIVPFLRAKYPDTKLGVIRYTNFFNNYNSDFDFVINYFENNKLELILDSFFTEDKLLSVHFISWQPSTLAFPKQDKQCWISIKEALEKAKTLLITRQYFEKKWLINCAHFLRYINNPVSLKSKIEKPVLIISSGPSLKYVINSISANRKSFFIICLSSALSPCLYYNIIPDLCMTSDGGFWAGQHLKKLAKQNIVLAMPSEAYCPVNILQSTKILPLNYKDGISSDLCKASGLSFLPAVRNGTVSGTALLWAIENSCSDIFLTGLDMACQKGFQHTQPNELEINSCIKDNHITSKEKRLAAAQFGGTSLDIYKKWFENFNFNDENRHLYRIINPQDKQNTLGIITDIDIENFTNKLKKIDIRVSNNTENNYFESQKFQNILSCKKALDFFIKHTNDIEWKKQLFPLDYVLLAHGGKDAESKIEENYKTLQQKIKEIFL